MAAAADRLLARLQAVRGTAPERWIARCPGHEDRTPSLSIRETADGKVLLRCFAGCAAADVVHAVGLTLADLFDRPADPQSGDRPHRRRHALRVPAADLVLMLDHEATVLAIAAADIVERRTVDGKTWDRVAYAARRIGWCADHIREACR